MTILHERHFPASDPHNQEDRAALLDRFIPGNIQEFAAGAYHGYQNEGRGVLDLDIADAVRQLAGQEGCAGKVVTYYRPLTELHRTFGLHGEALSRLARSYDPETALILVLRRPAGSWSVFVIRPEVGPRDALRFRGMTN